MKHTRKTKQLAKDRKKLQNIGVSTRPAPLIFAAPDNKWWDIHRFKPHCLKVWTTIHFGTRGSGKTLHQAKQVKNVLQYLRWLYNRKRELNKMAVWTNFSLAKWIYEKYPDLVMPKFNSVEEIHYCPRKNCWRGTEKHSLHNALLVFDDVSTMFAPTNWHLTPNWLKKIWIQGRHSGIHCLASLIDPFDVDIAFRRCVDTAYRFSKLFGNRDPEEVMPKVKRVFGIYRYRYVPADVLWAYGNLPEEMIRAMQIAKEERDEYLKEIGKAHAVVYDDSWIAYYSFWTSRHVNIYNTLEDIAAYEPTKLAHTELKCGTCGSIRVSHKPT